MFDRSDEGVEAWEFSAPSAFDGEGERIPFDERPGVELQMELEALYRRDKRDPGLWLGLISLLLVFLLLVPGESALVASGIVAAGMGAATLGVLRVRRRQLSDAFEAELAARRREELEDASEPAYRLVVLRDALDRLEDRSSRRIEIALGAAATVIFSSFGFAEGLELGLVLGAFFGLLTALTFREERRRLAEEMAMKDEVRAIEARRELPPAE